VPQGLVLDRRYLLFQKALLYTVRKFHINKPVAADALNNTCAFRSAYHILKVDGLVDLLQALASVVALLLALLVVRFVVLLPYPFSRPL